METVSKQLTLLDAGDMHGEDENGIIWINGVFLDAWLNALAEPYMTAGELAQEFNEMFQQMLSGEMTYPDIENLFEED